MRIMPKQESLARGFYETSNHSLRHGTAYDNCRRGVTVHCAAVQLRAYIGRRISESTFLFLIVFDLDSFFLFLQRSFFCFLSIHSFVPLLSSFHSFAQRNSLLSHESNIRKMHSSKITVLLSLAALTSALPFFGKRVVASLDQAAFEEAQQRDATATRAFSAIEIKTSTGQCLFINQFSGDFRANLVCQPRCPGAVLLRGNKLIRTCRTQFRSLHAMEVQAKNGMSSQKGNTTMWLERCSL